MSDGIGAAPRRCAASYGPRLCACLSTEHSASKASSISQRKSGHPSNHPRHLTPVRTSNSHGENIFSHLKVLISGHKCECAIDPYSHGIAYSSDVPSVLPTEEYFISSQRHLAPLLSLSGLPALPRAAVFSPGIPPTHLSSSVSPVPLPVAPPWAAEFTPGDMGCCSTNTHPTHGPRSRSTPRLRTVWLLYVSVRAIAYIVFTDHKTVCYQY